MTQTISITATIKDNVLEEISSNLSSLGAKFKFSQSISKKWKTAFSVFKLNSMNLYKMNQSRMNGDFAKQITENLKTYVDAFTQSRNQFNSQNTVDEKKRIYQFGKNTK